MKKQVQKKKTHKAILTINIPNQYNNLSRIDNNQVKITNISPKLYRINQVY